ncbi:MAG: MFS transporter, partial [Proteobacteria bacterium]|nr:MFS transporter [Pseudomonadota bacterium]
GARLWIARIMITWGILSGITAFVGGTTSFAIVRFLLGVAEAGFFPGLVLYFTYWFPHYHHARIMSGFLIGLPIAVAAGAPISTALLSLNGFLGLHGWQHMFLFEALPTVLIGFVVLAVLVDKPVQAKWLTAAEKEWLVNTIEQEQANKDAVQKFSMWQAMFDKRVLLLSLNYLGIVTASLGQLLFIPQIIKSLGVSSNMAVGWLTMVPYICATFSLLGWAWLSDRLNERRWCLFWTCVMSTAGLVLAGMTMGTWWALVGMSVAAMGFYGSKGPFWAMPPMFLTGTAAAATIAWINSIGNLGGFFGPWYVGVMRDLTGSFSGGLYGLAIFGFIAAAVCAFFLDVQNHAVEKEARAVASHAD